MSTPERPMPPPELVDSLRNEPLHTQIRALSDAGYQALPIGYGTPTDAQSLVISIGPAGDRRFGSLEGDGNRDY